MTAVSDDLDQSAAFVTSSGIKRDTLPHRQLTMSRRIPRRMTAFCLFAASGRDMGRHFDSNARREPIAIKASVLSLFPRY